MEHRRLAAKAPMRAPVALGSRRAALAVSIALHALLLGVWPDMPNRVRREAPSEPARAMSIRLQAALPAPPGPTARVPAAAPATRPRAPRGAARPQHLDPPERIEAVAPAPREEPLHEPIAVPADDARPAPIDGAAFAGMFAPLLGQPLGRSGWARVSRARPEAPPPDAAWGTQQALAALRATLLDRLANLGARLASNGSPLQCDIAVDGKRHVAEVRCADPADRAMPWSAMQELLAAGPVAPRDADLCFTLAPAQAAAIPCTAAEPGGEP